MALYDQLRQDLKKRFPFVQTALNQGASKGAAILGNFTKQINGYEKRIKILSKDIDHKREEVRTLGKVRLNQFVSQLKKTRNRVETQVVSMVQDERKRLNGKLDELLGFLNKTEKKMAHTHSESCSHSTQKKSAAKSKKTSKRKVSKKR